MLNLYERMLYWCYLCISSFGAMFGGYLVLIFPCGLHRFLYHIGC